MRLKALMLVLLVFCVSFTVFSATTRVLSNVSAASDPAADSFVLVDGGNGTIVRPMGPIDTPGGPT
jgi:hypothetical protein